MKTRRIDQGYLVIDGGPMDGVLIHESNIPLSAMLLCNEKVKQHLKTDRNGKFTLY